MYDKDFLLWLHDRLVYKHKENPEVDYMHKLRAIIKSIDPLQETPNISSTHMKEGDNA